MQFFRKPYAKRPSHDGQPRRLLDFHFSFPGAPSRAQKAKTRLLGGLLANFQVESYSADKEAAGIIDMTWNRFMKKMVLR